MTLAEFCADRKLQGPLVTESGATYVMVPLSTRALTDMYNLVDFAVSSRSGLTVWFTPR